jgi:superfamily II DNA or RNA helicase
MATGFLPIFLKFVEEEYQDLIVEIVDEREDLPRFKEEFVSQIGNFQIEGDYLFQKNLVQSLNKYITFRGQKIYFPRGVLNSATNAGKSTVIAAIYLNMEKMERMLVVIHRKTVYRQLVQFFQEMFPEVGEINDQQYNIKPVTVAMVQTMYRRIDDMTLRKDLAQFTILAVDEMHLSGSSMYSRVLLHCNAGLRVGLSGTAFDSDNIVNKMISVGAIGPECANVSKRTLMDTGISTPVKVHILLCNTVLSFPIVDYDECIDAFIYYSKERVALMAQIIKDRIEAGPILIAVDKTRHGEFVQQQLKEQFKIYTELTHSKDPEIKEKIQAFKDGQIDAIISTGVMREGLNLPLIATIIYASGGKAKISVKQWSGRGERKHESKTEVLFYDFFDKGRFVTSHSKARIKIYEQEQLEIIYHYETIKKR